VRSRFRREGLRAARPTVAATAATVATAATAAGNANVAAIAVIAPRLAQRPSNVVAVEQGADDDAGNPDIQCSRWYEVLHACHYSTPSQFDKSSALRRRPKVLDGGIHGPAAGVGISAVEYEGVEAEPLRNQDGRNPKHWWSGAGLLKEKKSRECA